VPNTAKTTFSAVLLVGAASALGAAPAHARSSASAAGAPLALATALPAAIRFPPPICLPPQLAQCQSVTYLATNCGQVNKLACANMLNDEAARQAASWGTRYGELPPAADNPDYHGVNHPGAGPTTAVTSGLAPYDYSTHYANHLNGLYIGTVTRNQLVSVNPSIFTFDPRVGWQSDGTRIRSCEEFTYKRYRTFSRFEDAIAPYAANFVVQYYIALYGDDGIANKGITDDAGNPTFTLTLPSRAKNVFFEFSPLAYVDVPDGMPRHAIDVDFIKRHAALFDAHSYWSSSWSEVSAWGNWFLGNWAPDVLERYDQKVAAFEDMIARRRAVMTAYRDERRYIDRGVCIRRFGVTSTASYCGDDAVSLPLRTQLLAKYQPQVTALDNQIDAAQHEAETLGCMADGITPCDWSPHQFIRMINRAMAAPREGSFKLCNAVLHNDFRVSGSRLAKLKAEGWPEAGLYPGDLNQSAQILEYALEHVRDYVNSYVRNLPLDPSTGKPMLGDGASDDASIGNWAFGAHYDYSLGFKIDGIETGVSNGQMSAWATMHAGGNVFGGTIPLVTGSIVVQSHDEDRIARDISFVVLGNELLPGRSGDDPLEFHVTGGDSIGGTPVYGSTVIPVGPIPVKVAGWITAVAGIKASLDGNISRVHSPDPQIDALGAGVSGTIDPYAELVAHASASIDLLIIEAGIKGRLTLVRVDLPFTIGVGVTMQQSSDQSRIDSVLEGSANLNLVLHSLDGALTVFVDTPFKSYEKDVVSWEGYQATVPLFNREFRPISLSDIHDSLTGAF
jgi:hypothetical protein